MSGCAMAPHVQASNPLHSNAYTDYSYADELSREELGNYACRKADEKCTPVKSRPSGEGAVAECKTPGMYMSYDDDEKACTPFQKGICDEGFLEEGRYHLDDEKIASSLHVADQKEYHRIRIGELFDSDYAKHLAEDDTHDSKTCYTNYVNKKWDNVESYLDDVAGGICISLLLPELDTYKVSIFENHSIQVDGYRKVQKETEEQKAPGEYKADYSFEGATRGISDDMVEHEYIATSGILFIFVQRLRLRGPSSQCYISPSKQQDSNACEMEKPKLVNEKKEQNHFVSKNNTDRKGSSQNSFMLRVKKSTLGRMLSFQGK